MQHFSMKYLNSKILTSTLLTLMFMTLFGEFYALVEKVENFRLRKFKKFNEKGLLR